MPSPARARKAPRYAVSARTLALSTAAKTPMVLSGDIRIPAQARPGERPRDDQQHYPPQQLAQEDRMRRGAPASSVAGAKVR